MNVLRYLTTRSSLVAAILGALNVTALMVLFSSLHVQDKLWYGIADHQQQLDTKAYPPSAILPDIFRTTSNATITVTSIGTTTATTTATTTVTVTASPRIEPMKPPPPVKPPGPAFCDACGPDDALCALYGEHALARSRVYEGANARFHRVITNALAGKRTKIGVIGGSVTKGHALTQNHQENWTILFRDAWKKFFPGSETTLVNGAVAATGSDYFSMCFGEHVDEDVDLVIIELSVNDQRNEKNAIAYEWLMRGLLALPKNPAVLNLHTMALNFDTITLGGDLHTPIAEYYDSPVISLRNMLLTHVLEHPDLDVYYYTKFENGEPDWRHVGVPGHKILADLLSAYTQRQICAVEKKVKNRDKYISSDGILPGTDGLETIPRLRLFQKYDRTTVTRPFTPMCQSIQTKKHPLTPIENHGWREWARVGQPHKPYLIAQEPGATVKFAVVSALMGRVRITFLRSKTFGLGDVWCWLDDDRKGGKRVGSWWNHDDFNVANVATIAVNAAPGKHTLSCELMRETSDPGGGHEFRLIGVDAS